MVKCAWVGDSRAVLMHPKGGSMDLSHDHRVSATRRPALFRLSVASDKRRRCVAAN
jgi:serine/threonine protein phosphatase PrpC